jgi:hypothetical protein
MKVRILVAGMAAVSIGAAAAPPPLSAYTGGYASNTVNGYSFWKNPIVRRATQGAVANPTIVKAFLAWGVEDMVKDTAGASLAWGCEAHNCGDHNGTIVVVRPNGPAAVCYHDAGDGDQSARWYIGGKMISRDLGACPSDVPPPAIVAALKRR